MSANTPWDAKARPAYCVSYKESEMLSNVDKQLEVKLTHTGRN